MRARIQNRVCQNNFNETNYATGLCSSESLFSRLSRWVVDNPVSQAEMLKLLSGSSLQMALLDTSLDDFSSWLAQGSVNESLPSIDQGGELETGRQKLARLLGMSLAQYLRCVGADPHPVQDVVFSATKFLRACPICLSLGFHSVYFQYAGALVCPYHQCALTCRCLVCSMPQEPTIRTVIVAPMSCPSCYTPWVMLNTALRQEKRDSVLRILGPMIDIRMQEILPLPDQNFMRESSHWWSPLWEPIAVGSERPLQVRRWTLWNSKMTSARCMNERKVLLDPMPNSKAVKAIPVARGVRVETYADGMALPVCQETVDSANAILRWLSLTCRDHLRDVLRVRSQMGLRPYGRALNENVSVVAVTLHQTMVNYGVQRNDACFTDNYERDWSHPYEDVRWNHLQMSRVSSDLVTNSCLIEAEILGWFAVALVLTARARYSLEVLWPWHLDAWHYVPPCILLREGTGWAFHYRSRATKATVERLIRRFSKRSLDCIDPSHLRYALGRYHPERR